MSVSSARTATAGLQVEQDVDALTQLVSGGAKRTAESKSHLVALVLNGTSDHSGRAELLSNLSGRQSFALRRSIWGWAWVQSAGAESSTAIFFPGTSVGKKQETE